MTYQPDPVQAGDLARFEPVLRARARHLVGVRLRRVVGPSDLLQETLLVGVRRFAELSGRPPREVLAWLLRTMQFRLMRYVRDHRVELSGRLGDPTACELVARGSSTAFGRMVGGELRNALLDQIHGLPEAERRVIVLLYQEKWPVERIAADLGRSEGAVRALHQRAVRRLRERLGNCQP